MAPALIETPQDSGAEKVYVKTQLQDGYKEAFAQGPKTTNWDNELKGVGKHPPAKYPHYLPVWDNEKDIGGKYPPNQPFEAYEHGLDADPSFQNLLKGATSVEDLTANIGAEVKGIQLSKLDKAGKDELALFVAQKKVVGKHHFPDPHTSIGKLTKSISFPRPRLCRPTNPRSPGFRRILRSLTHPPSLRRTKRLPKSPLGAQIRSRHNSQRLL
jgi:hypothetical protein